MQHTIPADLVNRIHHADALNIMRELPDSSVDLDPHGSALLRPAE